VSPPDVFGFHPNADITKDMNETNLITESLLTCNSAGGGSSGGGSKEETLNKVCTKILESFPNVFSKKKYKIIIF
jgi:dynein heavy chain, axonemal